MFCSKPVVVAHRWEGALWKISRVETLPLEAAARRTDREGRGLAGTRLGLRDRVAHHEKRLDRSLLDGRWLLETIGVDATEKVLLETHVIEALNDFVPVGLHGTIGVQGNCTGDAGKRRRQQDAFGVRREARGSSGAG